MPAESKPNFFRLTFTDEQRAQVRASTGIDAEAIELTVRELEARIAPKVQFQDISLT